VALRILLAIPDIAGSLSVATVKSRDEYLPTIVCHACHTAWGFLLATAFGIRDGVVGYDLRSGEHSHLYDVLHSNNNSVAV
jgi:hypothetical protein